MTRDKLPDSECESAQDRCPTCGDTGPDFVSLDFDSGMYEAECGDEWHDGQSEAQDAG